MAAAILGYAQTFVTLYSAHAAEILSVRLSTPGMVVTQKLSVSTLPKVLPKRKGRI